MKLLCAFTGCVSALAGQNPAKGYAPVKHAAGIAWKVVGNWQQDADHTPLQSGDPIVPGGLLMPIQTKVAHSITLLLPDGQRILYECFTEQDCSRGFRIPTLTETPSPLAVRMLQQISHAMVEDRSSAPPAPLPVEAARTTVAKQDEALVVMDRANRAAVGGLLARMPNGEYIYNLAPLDHRQAVQLHIPMRKNASTYSFPVPSAGLYEVSIWDSQNAPRINLFLAAIEPQQANAFSTYSKAQKLIAEWDAEYYGWPIHDLLRAYLEALMHEALLQAATVGNTSSAHGMQTTAR